MRVALIAGLLLAAAASLAAAKTPWDPAVGSIGGKVMVIGHRGASGSAPEHTAAAYRTAIRVGANCIECDIVPTKDLKLVCRHEPWLQGTTNAEEKFADRETTYYLPEAGGNVTGIFSTDLTLAEIKTLTAKQAFAWRDQSQNGMYKVLTLAEYIAIVLDPTNPRTICAIPEVKHATWANAQPALQGAGVTVDELVIRELTRLGYDLQAPINSKAWLKRPLYIQSFEQNNLRYWAAKTNVPLVQLIDDVPTADTKNTPEYLMSEPGIKEISKYAYVFSPWKGLVVVTEGGKIVKINDEPVKIARKYGMPYCVWTLRNEPRYLASDYKGNVANEYSLWFNAIEANAGFSDHPGSLAGWVNSPLYKPGSVTTANFVTAGPPSWADAPRCDEPQSNIIYDTQGRPWGWANNMSCAVVYAQPGV